MNVTVCAVMNLQHKEKQHSGLRGTPFQRPLWLRATDGNDVRTGIEVCEAILRRKVLKGAKNVCFPDEKDENMNSDPLMLMCFGRAVKLDVDAVGEFDLCCFGGRGEGGGAK